jgi:cytochrome c oxidase assembly protein subunit 11
VTPTKAARYFKKIECFCFTEQRLEAGEKVDMPVSYFIDPAIADDPNLDDVSTVTLAYTFFPWDE